jgi:hypothetical protein
MVALIVLFTGKVAQKMVVGLGVEKAQGLMHSMTLSR